MKQVRRPFNVRVHSICFVLQWTKTALWCPLSQVRWGSMILPTDIVTIRGKDVNGKAPNPCYLFLKRQQNQGCLQCYLSFPKMFNMLCFFHPCQICPPMNLPEKTWVIILLPARLKSISPFFTAWLTIDIFPPKLQRWTLRSVTQLTHGTSSADSIIVGKGTFTLYFGLRDKEIQYSRPMSQVWMVPVGEQGDHAAVAVCGLLRACFYHQLSHAQKALGALDSLEYSDPRTHNQDGLLCAL